MHPSANRLGRLPPELQERIFAYAAVEQSPHDASRSNHPYYDAWQMVRRARMMTVLCDEAPAPAVGQKRRRDDEGERREEGARAWIERALPRGRQYVLFGLGEDARVDAHFPADLGAACFRVDRPWDPAAELRYRWCATTCGGVYAHSLALPTGERYRRGGLFLGCAPDCKGRRTGDLEVTAHRGAWVAARRAKRPRTL